MSAFNPSQAAVPRSKVKKDRDLQDYPTYPHFPNGLFLLWLRGWFNESPVAHGNKDIAKAVFAFMVTNDVPFSAEYNDPRTDKAKFEVSSVEKIRNNLVHREKAHGRVELTRAGIAYPLTFADGRMVKHFGDAKQALQYSTPLGLGILGSNAYADQNARAIIAGNPALWSNMFPNIAAPIAAPPAPFPVAPVAPMAAPGPFAVAPAPFAAPPAPIAAAPRPPTSSSHLQPFQFDGSSNYSRTPSPSPSTLLDATMSPSPAQSLFQGQAELFATEGSAGTETQLLIPYLDIPAALFGPDDVLCNIANPIVGAFTANAPFYLALSSKSLVPNDNGSKMIMEVWFEDVTNSPERTDLAKFGPLDRWMYISTYGAKIERVPFGLGRGHLPDSNHTWHLLGYELLDWEIPEQDLVTYGNN